MASHRDRRCWERHRQRCIRLHSATLEDRLPKAFANTCHDFGAGVPCHWHPSVGSIGSVSRSCLGSPSCVLLHLRETQASAACQGSLGQARYADSGGAQAPGPPKGDAALDGSKAAKAKRGFHWPDCFCLQEQELRLEVKENQTLTLKVCAPAQQLLRALSTSRCPAHSSSVGKT